MPRDPQRSKLKKYLGEILTYSAKIVLKGDSNIFLDVHYKNKLLTDHIWASSNTKIKNIDSFSDVTFTATAYSYIDSKGKRKYGLSKVHNVRKVKTSDNDESIINNEIQRHLRLGGHRTNKKKNRG